MLSICLVIATSVHCSTRSTSSWLLLHVPITTYKIIPNTNPNPKPTVYTTATPNQYYTIVIVARIAIPTSWILQVLAVLYIVIILAFLAIRMFDSLCSRCPLHFDVWAVFSMEIKIALLEAATTDQSNPCYCACAKPGRNWRQHLTL